MIAVVESNDEEKSTTDISSASTNDENESLENQILYDYEDLSTIRSSRRDLFTNSYSHKKKKNLSQENLLIQTYNRPNFMHSNINKERDLVLISGELLDKLSYSLEKRKIALEAAKQEKSSNIHDDDERAIFIEKEEMEIEELGKY